MSKLFFHPIKLWKGIMDRSCCITKAILKNLAKFTESTYAGVSFLRKMQAFKKKLQHRYLLDNNVKFLKTAILKNIWERLLLRVSFYRAGEMDFKVEGP